MAFYIAERGEGAVMFSNAAGGLKVMIDVIAVDSPWSGAAEGAVDSEGRVSNRHSTPTPFPRA